MHPGREGLGEGGEQSGACRREEMDSRGGRRTWRDFGQTEIGKSSCEGFKIRYLVKIIKGGSDRIILLQTYRCTQALTMNR